MQAHLLCFLYNFYFFLGPDGSCNYNNIIFSSVAQIRHGVNHQRSLSFNSPRFSLINFKSNTRRLSITKSIFTYLAMSSNSSSPSLQLRSITSHSAEFQSATPYEFFHISAPLPIASADELVEMKYSETFIRQVSVVENFLKLVEMSKCV